MEIEDRDFLHTDWQKKDGIVLSRLNVTLCSPSFLDAWSQVFYVTLARLRSGHYPLLISYTTNLSASL